MRDAKYGDVPAPEPDHVPEEYDEDYEEDYIDEHAAYYEEERHYFGDGDPENGLDPRYFNDWEGRR